jgi:gamma-glutamyltranspeptidase/glutathione hydrolase
VTYRRALGRRPTVATEAMVAASQPLATRAGLRMLEQGRNAVDAAIARHMFLQVFPCKSREWT